VGLFWGLLAALSYTTTNLLLRATAAEVEPFAGALIRTVPMTIAVWTLLSVERRFARAGPAEQRGRHGWPGWHPLWPLIVSGLIMSVIGNGSYQAALALGGLTVTLPAMTSASIWGSALGGWLLVGERLSRRSVFGLLLLVASLPLLTISGGGGVGPAWLGALAGATAGLSYGIANVVIRRTTVLSKLPHGLTVTPVVTAGLIGLIVAVLATDGLDAIFRLDPLTLGSVLVAGAFNALAFISLAKALTLLPVSRVGSLAATQTALSAVGGILIFAEPLTAWVGLGLVLSVVGVILAQQRPSSKQTSSAPLQQALAATDRDR
jgi:drug/metabolite transporter, DME family